MVLGTCNWLTCIKGNQSYTLSTVAHVRANASYTSVRPTTTTDDDDASQSCTIYLALALCASVLDSDDTQVTQPLVDGRSAWENVAKAIAGIASTTARTNYYYTTHHCWGWLGGGFARACCVFADAHCPSAPVFGATYWRRFVSQALCFVWFMTTVQKVES